MNDVDFDDIFGGEEEASDFTVFDIETGPLPDDELKRIRPCPPSTLFPSHPGQFDESSVKLGRLKDEQKIKEKIEDERKKHAAKLKSHVVSCEQILEHFQESFLASAPLSPITGQVLAIGYFCGGKATIEGGGEKEILASFWEHYGERQGAFIGFNITNFDIPFIVRRSWRHRLEIPQDIFHSNGRYVSRRFVDLMYRWKCASQFGDPKHVNSKLDTIAKFFGLAGKTDGVSGADFHRLWNGETEERKLAEEYLLNDVSMTADIAARMGVIYFSSPH